MTCTHTVDRSRYVQVYNDWTGEYEEEWHESVEHTTRDIGIGAYQCTQCGEVMYCTGSWRRFYETGEKVPCSNFVTPTEAATVRKAAKATPQGAADHGGREGTS